MLAAMPLSTAPARAAHPRPARPVAAAGQLIVGFRPATTPAAQQAIAHAAGASVIRRFGPIHAALVAFPGARGRVAAALARDPRVRYAEPNFLVHTDATPNDS